MSKPDKVTLDTRLKIIGRYQNIEGKADEINSAVIQKKGTYDTKNGDYNLKEFIQNVMSETGKGIINLIIFGIVFTFLPYLMYSFGLNIASIGVILFQWLIMYGVGSLTKARKQYNTLAIIGLTYPIWVGVWLIGKLTPLKYRRSKKEKELENKIKTLLLFQDSLVTQSILDNRYEKDSKVLESEAFKKGNNSEKKRLIRAMLNNYLDVEVKKSEALISAVKEEVVGKTNMLSGNDINVIYQYVLNTLNSSIRLSNGLVTRLYNILSSDSEGISLTSDFEYLDKNSKDELLIAEKELSGSDLQELIDILHQDYLYSKRYNYIKSNYEKVIQQEKERKLDSEYVRKHLESNNKKREEVKDKLTISNIENKWKERDEETKKIINQLNKEQLDLEEKLRV